MFAKGYEETVRFTFLALISPDGNRLRQSAKAFKNSKECELVLQPPGNRGLTRKMVEYLLHLDGLNACAPETAPTLKNTKNARQGKV